MKKSLYITGISGSLRKASYKTFRLNSLPERLENVVTLRNKLVSADGLVIGSPGFNYSTTGGLKKRSAGLSRGEDSPLLELPMQLSFHPIFQYLI